MRTALHRSPRPSPRVAPHMWRGGSSWPGGSTPPSWGSGTRLLGSPPCAGCRRRRKTRAVYRRRPRASHGHSRRSAGAENHGPVRRIQETHRTPLCQNRATPPRSQARLEPIRSQGVLDQLVEDGFFGTPPLVVNGFSRRRDELNENFQAVDRKCPS